MKKKILILFLAILFIGSAIVLSQGAYTLKIQWVDDNPVYIGKAEPGSVASDAVWQIMKLTWVDDNCTNLKYASGSNGFSFIWNNRATYTYE